MYDQLIFRPLLSWAEKFKSEIDDEDAQYESWFLNLLTKTRIAILIDIFLMGLARKFIRVPSKYLLKIDVSSKSKKSLSKLSIAIWYIALSVGILFSIYLLYEIINDALSLNEILHVFYLGLLTGGKVMFLIIIASIIWVPIGVWIGLNSRLCAFFQPIIQMLAAFPANFFYPIAVYLILRFNLNADIWTMPLMILGTQWYILFNVISGTSRIPKEIKMAMVNFKVRGWLWWRKLILPAIFPSFTTGAVTAAGGCWNASIVAEHVSWGNDTIISTGLGSYIEQFTRVGDLPRIALGISVMCFYVIFFNKIVWEKFYKLSESKFGLG